MNHWYTMAVPHKPNRSPSVKQPRSIAHPRKSKQLDHIRTLVRRKPIGQWFSASDVWDGHAASVDYVRCLLKGMAERGELVSEFRPVVSEHVGQCNQRYNKWMFKREK